jgi:hypothetical protein
MRNLRLGVDREWRRLKSRAAINKAWKEALPKLVGNFFEETPFQKLMRERNSNAS